MLRFVVHNEWIGILNETVYLPLICLILAIVICYKKLENPELRYNVPGPTANPMACTFVPLRAMMKKADVSLSEEFFNTICGFTKVFGDDGIWRFWACFRPIVLLCRAETAEVLLSNQQLTRKSVEYKFSKPWLRDGLLTSSGKHWKSRRRLLNSSFNVRFLEEFLVIMDEQSRILLNKLKKVDCEKPVDITPHFSRCALDIVCEAAMGIKLGAQEDEKTPYVESLRLVCEKLVHRALSPWLWPDFLYYSSRPGRKFREALGTINDFTFKVISERKKTLQQEIAGNTLGQEKRSALMDLMITHHINNNLLSLDGIQEEVNTFMFAGHDTTSHGTMWTLYLLGLHPEKQEKVIKEIDGIFDSDSQRPVGSDDLKSMNYLECCIKEAQRIYPPTPLIARELVEDIKINGYSIPKGTTCGVFVYMLHRDPLVFPNPEEFNPERFLPENINGRHPYSYLPFSAGIRNCIGQRFAMMEEKVVLANVFRQFTVTSVDSRDKLHVVPDIVLRSKYGLRMMFKSRRGRFAKDS